MPRPSFTVMVTACELYVVKHVTVLVEAPEIMGARRQEKNESQVTINVAGACDRNVDTSDISTNRDLTSVLTHTLPRHPAIRFKDKSER